ncbi:ventrally expressed dharma/bozozok antagonist [Betta splendens]|uniref:Ventrally expressed dharma/bozozok antagonist n=1 Tax=Betta splendens TaxID=158456 RepID=A0A9W2Y6Q9_BETSP|nr:ventrally expressed dharma/bozozok antagonist [Betta splendens]
MRGRFSIEWMAQSSLQAGSTRSESLPGFYCRQKPEPAADPAQGVGNQTQAPDVCSMASLQQQTPLSHQEVTSFTHTLLSDPQDQALGLELIGYVKAQGFFPLISTIPEAEFNSGTEEETSGYESEGGQSPSPSALASCTSSPLLSPSPPPPGRRPRTAFTAEQISSLELAFKRNAYLGTQEKADLCKQLSLSDKQIRNWFQNRRMKMKRTVQDALAHACQANVAFQFMRYPQLQAYRPGCYPGYHSTAAEGSTPAPYFRPPSVQYSAALPVPTVPLDSFYQYGSSPEVMLPPTTTPLMGSYPSYPQYYSHCQ